MPFHKVYLSFLCIIIKMEGPNKRNVKQTLRSPSTNDGPGRYY